MRSVKCNFVPVGLSLLLVLLHGATDSAKDARNVFLSEKGCPFDSVLAVTGSAYLLKNVGHKTITSYTLACLRRDGHKRKVDFVLGESIRETVHPDETTGEYAFDATPPNICRSRKTLLGVYEVRFSDGTFWKTKATR